MTLTPLDRHILAAVHALGAGAYGVPVRQEVERRLKEARRFSWGLSYGTLYTTLDRLEAAGLVQSQTQPGGPERGGRDKRYWWLTGDGVRELGGDEP
jgi:PadR family transcriptional regulator, regulatory protein PadR